jgi:hypothetical protein
VRPRVPSPALLEQREGRREEGKGRQGGKGGGREVKCFVNLTILKHLYPEA